MGDAEGILHAGRLFEVFVRNDVAEIRNVLQHLGLEVNSCVLYWDGQPHIWSPLFCAIAFFDENVIHMLLDEFGADLNLPCIRKRDSNVVDSSSYPLFRACTNPNERVLDFMLDHGASPFTCSRLPLTTKEFQRYSRYMIKTARKRCRTAWAAHWALSQHLVWRDMAQQVAQCIAATPVREFLAVHEDSRKKSKVSK
jgi:hypothetical protein